MKKLLHTFKSKQYRRRGLACATLLALLGFMILPASAQINAQKKYIFLSGQLTNTTTGAPIPDHQIYISSDSLLNNGFGYYATAKTDVNGFYRDTIVTTSSAGIIKIYLYDFDNIMIQLDRYYRFIWENEYLMFADFAIFNPDANEELQANFTPQEDPGENPLKIIFKDQSFGFSIKAWLWDFGDGETSTVQDPEHVYDQPGVYLVTLTIAALPECQNCLTSTITKQVQVGLTEYYHIGGHVFAQYFPIDLGLAYLYTYDSENHLVPVDTAQIDTLGFYYFYELDAGKKYLTKARLASGSVMYGQFMPTYLGNVFDWNYAQEIVLTDENNFECDIHLIPSDGIVSGQGQIVGQIIYDTSLVERSPIPAGDIEILLLDGQGTSLTCGLSDNDGNFTFSNIDNGTYQLFPDVAGISTTPMYVTISEGEPLAGDIKLVIYPQQITFSVTEHISTFVNQAFLIYPNPVSDQARISIQVLKASNMTFMVTDLLGRVISRQDRLLPEGSQEIILSVRELPAGLYEVVLIPEDKVMISGKFLKSN